MQKQKTIAKWLAVILLLTVAVACYIALSAVLQNQKTDAGNIAGADEQTKQPNIDDITPLPQPIYTTLPRKCETVDNMLVQHIGGENDEKLLDSIFIAQKRYVIFSTTSTQYDVKQSGLYIAVFDNSNLQEVCKVADIQEEYLCSTITQNGILLVTATAQNTTLRLLSTSLKTIAINTLKCYEQMLFYSHANTVFALAYDKDIVQHISISNSLDITTSNFVYQAHNLSLFNVIGYGEQTLIVLHQNENTQFLTFNKNKGFTLKNEYINCKIKQFLPIYSNGEQLFFTLSIADNNAVIACLDTNFELRYQKAISSVDDGIILQHENGIALYTKNTLHTFCAHLDTLATTEYEQNIDIENMSFTQILGLQNMFVAKGENTIKLFVVNGKNVNIVFECECDTSNIIVEKQFSKLDDATYDYTIILSASSHNDFAYMAFGKNDIFVLSVNSQSNIV